MGYSDRLQAAAITPIRPAASADIAFDDESQPSAVLAGTRVRLVARGADCRVVFAAAPVAVATDMLLIDGVPEYFQIQQGHKVAAIRDAGDNGVLNITVAV